MIANTHLWVFLQNVININYEYLSETPEFDMFKNNSCFSISVSDIIDKSSDDIIYVNSFTELIFTIKNFMESQYYTDSIKYKILTKSIPILERISLEIQLENMSI